MRTAKAAELLFSLPKIQGVQESLQNKVLTVEPYLASLPVDEQYKLGLRLDEIIVDCKFDGIKCSEMGEFLLYKHYIHINCYTFRHNTTNKGDNYKLRSGPEHGLSLILTGNSRTNPFYNVDSNVANVIGYKVAIHERGTVPPIVNNRIDLQPGQSTNIAMVARKHTRLDKPYGDCYQQQEDEDGNGPSNNNFRYSKEMCEQEKLAKLVLETCECTSTKFYSRHASSNHEKNCFFLDENVTLETVSLSLRNALCEIVSLDTGVLLETEDFECIWPCNEWSYDTYMSATQWLPRSMVNSFLRVYVQSLSCKSPIYWYYEALLHHYNDSIQEEICRENPYLFNYTRSYTREDIFSTAAQIQQGEHVILGNFVNATLRPDIDESLLNYSNAEDAVAEWIKTHFYRLNVYFRETAYEHHTQVESISFTDLCSSVGGTLGLWCGFSVITAVEICVFIGKSFKMQCLSCRKKYNESEKDMKSNENDANVKIDKV